MKPSRTSSSARSSRTSGPPAGSRPTSQSWRCAGSVTRNGGSTTPSCACHHSHDGDVPARSHRGGSNPAAPFPMCPSSLRAYTRKGGERSLKLRPRQRHDMARACPETNAITANGPGRLPGRSIVEVVWDEVVATSSRSASSGPEAPCLPDPGSRSADAARRPCRLAPGRGVPDAVGRGTHDRPSDCPSGRDTAYAGATPAWR